MKKLLQHIFYLMIFIFITSCSKLDVINPVDFQKQLISGTGAYLNSKHTWQLDSTSINGVNLTLSSSERNYKKLLVMTVIIVILIIMQGHGRLTL